MNIIEIFFSPSSTTKKVVEQVSSNFNGNKETYDLLNFNAEKEFSSAVQKGDVRTVEVYLSPKGDYRIPAYTSGGAYGVMNIVYIGSVVAGLLLGIMTAVVCFLPDSPQKKNGKQNKP